MKSFFYFFFFVLSASTFSQSASIKMNVPMHDLLIDAGGHKLHLNVTGNGSPTVIFENGSGDFSFIWSLVQPQVSEFTKSISYDRAGYAWSESGPMPRTAHQLSFELHTALENAGVKPPYILVGQSFGGFIVRAFARHYPKEVAGMVLVDVVPENGRILIGGKPTRIREFASGRPEPAPQQFFKSAYNEMIDSSAAAQATIEPPLDRLPDSIQKLQLWAQVQKKYIEASSAEMEWSPEDVANLYKHQGESAYKLGNIPLIVITRGKGGYDGRSDSLELETERLQLQKQLSQLSTNSKFIVDQNSGHNIHLEDPAIVIQCIREVYEAAKNHKRLKGTK
jgi:pimeloyl-ACP methyl ester carboxylesterase